MEQSDAKSNGQQLGTQLREQLADGTDTVLHHASVIGELAAEYTADAISFSVGFLSGLFGK
jgi:hypothetical protein